MPTEIDLENAQSLLASAKDAKDYLFYLIKADPKYTAEAFEENPNCVAAADLYFKSAVILDRNGKGSVPLSPKAKEIKDKLTAEKTNAYGVLLATEKTGVGLPKAVLSDFVLRREMTAIKLKAIRAFAEPSQWASYHHAVCFIEMEVSGELTKVIMDTQPKPYDVAPGITGVWTSTGPGQYEPAKLVLGSLGEAHAPNAACGLGANFHGNFDFWSRCFSDNHHTLVDLGRAAGPKPDTYVIGLYPRATGRCVLTVTGTGDWEKKVSAQIEFGFNGTHPHPGD